MIQKHPLINAVVFVNLQQYMGRKMVYYTRHILQDGNLRNMNNKLNKRTGPQNLWKLMKLNVRSLRLKEIEEEATLVLELDWASKSS